ncbi:helix-turn-helix domain-containing protein [Salmonella enterica subsp. enterica serovar Enteritidis]|nr:helix-turn-helix domain-containing protein [Salmonella enterica subsp. enterica serovar Enteritidis]EGT9239803.1 helix-turn-helix domain-containing protein [Salmonella enterica]
MSPENVLLKNLYITNVTLIKLNKGKVTIKSSDNEVIEYSEEGLILLDKNQVLNFNFVNINEHLEFKIIDIPYNVIKKIHNMLTSINNISTNSINVKYESLSSTILCSPLRPGMNEAFDYLFENIVEITMYESNHDSNCKENADISHMEFTMMFLLSPFSYYEEGVNIFARAVKSSLREKTFNMIRNDLSKAWCLDDVASKLYMSRSSFKRKLAREGTSFSKIYLDVRMSFAAKLLRTGDYKISQVAEICGYTLPSHFSATFKKYFQMTPYTFMNLVNH